MSECNTELRVSVSCGVSDFGNSLSGTEFALFAFYRLIRSRNKQQKNIRYNGFNMPPGDYQGIDKHIH